MPEPNTAEVLNQDGPEIKDDAKELTAVADKVDANNPQANANEPDDETDGHKRLGGWQRKIKKLQEQNETLLELLRSGGKDAKPAQEKTATQEEKPPVKPKLADFKTWEEFDEAKDKYHEDLAKFESKKAVENYKAEHKQQSQQQTIADGWAAQCAEAEKEFADFKEVAFSSDVPMSDAMMQAIVTSEFGAKVAYELGKDPDEAERISKLSPVAAIREIGKIESRIAGKTPAAEDKDKEDDVPPAASTRAPRPPVPVRKTASNPSDLDDKIPYKEWLRRREAQLRSK